MSCTSAAWPMQVAHHGAQNHRITGLPARAAASNGFPSSVLPLNLSDAGTSTGVSFFAESAGLVRSSRADVALAPAHPAASIVTTASVPSNGVTLRIQASSLLPGQ